MKTRKKQLANVWAALWGLKHGQDYQVTWNDITIRLTYCRITPTGSIKFHGDKGPITLPFITEGTGWSMKAITD